VADGDGLENHCGGNVTVGSNPTPSALDLGNSLDLRLWPPISRSALVTDRSQMQPTAAICRWSRDIRGMDLEPFPQVGAGKRGSQQHRDPRIVDRSGSQRLINPPVSDLLAAIDALRVDPQQDFDAVPSTLGHLRDRDSAVQP
jgi:hypothetical protein